MGFVYRNEIQDGINVWGGYCGDSGTHDVRLKTLTNQWEYRDKTKHPVRGDFINSDNVGFDKLSSRRVDELCCMPKKEQN